jgi:hypothetical protein
MWTARIRPTILISAAALSVGCGNTRPVQQVASATYSIPSSVEELAVASSILVRGKLLDEPIIKAIEMPAPERGERQEEALWSYELSHILVVEVVGSRSSSAGKLRVGDQILVGVSVLNPAVGIGLQTAEPDLAANFPSVGKSLSRRVGESGLFLLTGARSLGDAATNGFEVIAYRSGTASGGPLIAVPGPLRDKPVTEAQLVAAALRSFRPSAG